nr:immunoglobulin light chain junction region [Macaca mulatta]MOX17381.1 immunoglobulin light chain junction region [Macaca mulatta]MOX17522.1 immunoglobulin light chain junction region [Macaca mulatta]MOX17684.1 immunoglobulin light chain junction region [Macaca mulatta]MOX18296.1 immunoglobulin light chain junction region [Macaca mulatta]
DYYCYSTANSGDHIF